MTETKSQMEFPRSVFGPGNQPGKNLPRSSREPYSDRGPGKTSPVAPVTGGRLESPVTNRAPGARTGEDIEQALTMAKEFWRECLLDLANANQTLSPYFTAVENIRQEIMETHGGRILNLEPSAIQKRRRYFDDMLDLTIKWGPDLRRRSELSRAAKSAEKLVEHLERERKRQILKLRSKQNGKR